MSTLANFLPLRNVSLIKGLAVIHQQPMTVSTALLLDVTVTGRIRIGFLN
jgi:hypothetical protein